MMGNGGGIREECIQLCSIALPADTTLSQTTALHEKDDVIEILWVRLPLPFHFLSHGGYRHPVNRFAPSPRRMAHLRSRFPTDNNMAFNESVGGTPQRAISGSYRGCGFAGNYIVYARSLSASTSEIRRIRPFIACRWQ